MLASCICIHILESLSEINLLDTRIKCKWLHGKSLYHGLQGNSQGEHWRILLKIRGGNDSLMMAGSLLSTCQQVAMPEKDQENVLLFLENPLNRHRGVPVQTILRALAPSFASCCRSFHHACTEGPVQLPSLSGFFFLPTSYSR